MEELILARAKTLFFTYGLKSVSMDDLARAAGVSKKTVYQFFADKQELVRKVAGQLIACHHQAWARSRAEARNAVEEVFLQVQLPFAALAEVHPSFFYDLEKFFPLSWQLVTRHRDETLVPFIEGNLQRGIGEGLYRADVDRPLATYIRLQQWQSVLQPAGLRAPVAEPRQLLHRLTRFYLQAITNGKGRGRIDPCFQQTTLYKLEQ